MDLQVFRELCRTTAQRLDEPAASMSLVLPLRRFAVEFRDVGYQLLRHSDRELFDRFLDLLDNWGGQSLENTFLHLVDDVNTMTVAQDIVQVMQSA